MGNSRSRQRPPATPAGAEGGQGAQNPPPPQYTPSQVYQPQQVPPYYSQPQPYLNNGQYYAGWRPPPGQYPPYPHQPQTRLPHQPPYPHPPPHAGGQQPPPGQQPAQPQPAQELTQTATIRNAVNLKKNTLCVSALEGDPSKLAISFTFDASAPCSVTTFVMATEDPMKGCKLTPAKQLPAPAVVYEKGLGLKFQIPPRPAVAHAAAAATAAEGGSEGAAAGAAGEQPAAAGAAEQPPQHVIDMSLYSEDSLTRHDKDTYPLVIRLETVTDKGLKDGHTLQELVPGFEQKVWVQSQTTFAQLHREEDGSWVVRVVKQKIWVAGVSYELQEIYGLEQAGGAKAEAAVSAEDDEERLCVICLVNDRDTTVLPCRHMCMCHECAQELRKQTSKCPICRNHVESLLHIKMHGKKPPSSQATGAAAAMASA